jgi:hypothetical protein
MKKQIYNKKNKTRKGKKEEMGDQRQVILQKTENNANKNSKTWKMQEKVG